MENTLSQRYRVRWKREEMEEDRIKISGDLEKTEWEPVPSWFINEDKENIQLKK